MPHINDVSINNIWDGNNGEKWQITGKVESPDELLVTISQIKVVEELIKE